MTNEGLNKLLNIIAENKGNKHHISKLIEYLKATPLSMVQITQTIMHYSKCIKKELV